MGHQSRMRPLAVRFTRCCMALKRPRYSDALYVSGSTTIRQLLLLYISELRDVRPILNGSDLLALGVPTGPQVGDLLHDLLMARLDQQVVTRQDELKFIRARL